MENKINEDSIKNINISQKKIEKMPNQEHEENTQEDSLSVENGRRAYDQKSKFIKNQNKVSFLIKIQ